MNKVIIMRGLPGSGKTTWARQWVADGTNRLRINRDDIRFLLFGRYVDVDENLVTKTQNAILTEAMRTHYDIVIDNTNLNSTHLKRLLLRVAKDDSYVAEIHDMDTSLEDCILRDSERGRVVGEDVIRRMHSRAALVRG